MKIEKPKSKQPLPEHAKCVFKGVMFDVYQWEQEQFDGSTKTFEKLKRPDTVIVLPVLPDGKILLTEQEQPGKGIYLSSAGGRKNEDETVLETAKRELLEETGYEAKNFKLWHSVQPISKMEWSVYVFIARNLKKISEPSLDSGEKVKLMPVSFEEFIENIFNGSFADVEILWKLISLGLRDQNNLEVFEKVKKEFLG